MRAVLSKMSGWRAGLGHPHSALRLASQLSNFSFHELTASIYPDTDTAEVQGALGTATLSVWWTGHFSSAANRSIGSTTGFHNHREGPY